jgi:RHS repeat-associated protein
LARLQEANYSIVGEIEGSLIATFRYDYDVAGNRLKAETTAEHPSAGTVEYEYNAGNQIARRRTNGGAWVNFTYDNNGNLTNDGVSAYTWDRANRLLTVGTTINRYNGLGSRVYRNMFSFEVEMVPDLQPGLAENAVIHFPSWGTYSRMVRLAGDRLLVLKDPFNNWEWALADGLDSVRGMTTNAGAVLEHRHFEPYGELYGGTMNDGPYGFTGQWRDSETELNDLRARMYSPRLGSFTSRDPLETPNRYAYVDGREPGQPHRPQRDVV